MGSKRIKITYADKFYGYCIKERVNWTCEHCGVYYPEGSRGGIECSHLFGRGSYATRFDPDNSFAHCTSCHFYLGGNPVIFHQWAEAQIGPGIIEILSEKRNNVDLAKSIKKAARDVAAHYRKEYERMKEMRATGVTGRIEIKGY